jgi:hypothetical protein
LLKLLNIFFGFIFFINAQGQSANNLDIIWGLIHPISAIKIKKISKSLNVIYNLKEIKLELDSFENGGKLDAFRHTFFMAAFAQKVKISKLRKLGIAHEKGNYRQFIKNQTENKEIPDSMGTVMDLFNNELGYKIGKANKNLLLPDLKLIVLKEIQNGNALIIKRNKMGKYLDCENNIINVDQFFKKWYVPKCLVKSDYVY